MVAHALVLPSDNPEEREQYAAGVEAIAVRLARAYEEESGARVDDVSRPELARRAGLTIGRASTCCPDTLTPADVPLRSKAVPTRAV